MYKNNFLWEDVSFDHHTSLTAGARLGNRRGEKICLNSNLLLSKITSGNNSVIKLVGENQRENQVFTSFIFSFSLHCLSLKLNHCTSTSSHHNVNNCILYHLCDSVSWLKRYADAAIHKFQLTMLFNLSATSIGTVLASSAIDLVFQYVHNMGLISAYQLSLPAGNQK